MTGTKVFATTEVAEVNTTTYPAPFRAGVEKRHVRRLGGHAGLTHFGVNLVRVEPGGISSQRHWHSKADEFVMLLDGELTLETDAGARTVGAGTCIAFPAGSGDGHRFVNRSSRDATFVVVGDRSPVPGDEVDYPDIDMVLRPGPDGKNVFMRRDGTKW